MECESTVSSECFNISEKTLAPLNLIQYATKTINFLLLWNEYSILIKDTSRLMATESFHYTDFYVKQIYLQENVFLCLDKDHILYFTILKKKNESRILETLEFKQILKNALIIFGNESDIYVVLKKENSLCIYKYTFIGPSKIKVTNIYKLNEDIIKKDISLQDFPVSMLIRKLKYFTIDFIQNIFLIEMSKINMDMLVLFVIKENVLYWSLLEEDSNKLSTLHPLYSSPVNIKSFHISNDDQITINLNLDTGSIVILSYDIVHKCLSMDIVHLNSPLDRIIHINSALIYSDTCKVYHSVLQRKTDEYNVIAKNVFPIQSPYNFIYDSTLDCLYCTTFHNIIYKIFLRDLKLRKSVDTVTVPRNFTSVKSVISEIQEEMKRNNTFVNLTDKENDYISILFLNSKRDSVSNCISTDFKVYMYNNQSNIDYHDTPMLFSRDVLRNEILNVVRLHIDESLRHKLEKIMNNAKDMFFSNIHFTSDTLYDSYSMSIMMNKTPNVNLAIPHNTEVNLPFTVNTSIISLMPGVFQQMHKFWSFINTNKILVDSTYFFTCESVHEKENTSKNPQYRHYQKILSVAEKNANLLFDIREDVISENEPFSLFIKLPDNFEKLCDQFSDHFTRQLSPSNAKNIKMRLTDTNFVHGHKTLILQGLNETIQLDVQKLESNEHRLKVTSTHKDTCYQVYGLVLNILKTIQRNNYSRKQYLPHFDYVILKDLKQNVENEKMMTKDNLLVHLESFHQDVLGVLPV